MEPEKPTKSTSTLHGAAAQDPLAAVGAVAQVRPPGPARANPTPGSVPAQAPLLPTCQTLLKPQEGHIWPDPALKATQLTAAVAEHGIKPGVRA